MKLIICKKFLSSISAKSLNWAEKDNWKPEPEFFLQSPEKIAQDLKECSESFLQARARLHHYLEREKDRMSDVEIKNLKAARHKLRTVYNILVA